MIVEYDCEVCGAFVRRRRSPATMKVPPRFCSQACNGLSRKGTGRGPRPNHAFNCETCGRSAEVYRSPSAAAPRFCSIKCLGAAQLGERNPAFSGGRHILANGYAVVLAPDHPGADSRGYVYEHRLVMERALGRLLMPGEVVHHSDGDKLNNDPENLGLFASQADHMRHHREHR